MSVENSRIIDFISEKDSKIVLTISDHLEWDEENEHIFLLQEKINAYLMAIESGQVHRNYTSSKSKEFVINVALKYQPDESGVLFLQNVVDTLSKAGYEFNYYLFDET
ncbi:MAG: DUF6572 domain-containing protein [Paludibacter sp.]|nr:DUF6572 domain-containing protein [Paludibacter sp.]